MAIGNPPSLAPLVGIYNVDQMPPALTASAAANSPTGYNVLSGYSVMNAIPNTQVSNLSNTTSFTLTGANMVGAADVTIILTGTLAANANITSATLANMMLAINLPNANTVGYSGNLRIINASSANFTWTLLANTGVNLSGTMTIAQNTFRDFYISITSATSSTITSVGTGTYS